MSARPAALGLALLASVLAATIALELDAGRPAGDAGGIVAAVRRPRPLPHAVAPRPPDRTDAWAATALARPLFSRDRKPTPAEAGAGGPSFAALPRLSGVVIGPFGRTAIFAASDGGKPLLAAEGRQIGRYTVEAIEPGRVTVAGPEGQLVLVPTADAVTRQAMAAVLPATRPGVPGLPPGALPRGATPVVPFAVRQRQNLLSFRPGVGFQPGVPGQPPSREGSD